MVQASYRGRLNGRGACCKIQLVQTQFTADVNATLKTGVVTERGYHQLLIKYGPTRGVSLTVRAMKNITERGLLEMYRLHRR